MLDRQGRWVLYRDTYINGVNEHAVVQRVSLDARVNGTLRTWSADVQPGAPWELSLASMLAPAELTGIVRFTGALTCETPTPDGTAWAPADCSAQVALWHAPISYGVAATVYNVPFSCAQ